MAELDKLGKKKGILVVRDMLYAGRTSGEVTRFITENHGKHTRTIDEWIKCAKPLVQEMYDHDERKRQEEQDRLTAESVAKHHVTKDRLVARLSEIVFGDPTALFTVDGGLKPISEWTPEMAGMIAGIESFDQKPAAGGEVLGTNRKIKILNPIEAAKLLAEILGYKAPVKSEVTEKKLRIGYAKPAND